MEINKDCDLACSSNKYKHKQDVAAVCALEEVGHSTSADNSSLEIVMNDETNSDTMDCSSDSYDVLDLSIINGSDDVPFVYDNQDDIDVSMIYDNDDVLNHALIDDIDGSVIYDNDDVLNHVLIDDIDGSVIYDNDDVLNQALIEDNEDDIDVLVIYDREDDTDVLVIYEREDDIDVLVIYEREDANDVLVIYANDSSNDYANDNDVSDRSLNQHDMSDSDDDDNDDNSFELLERRFELGMFSDDSGCSDVNDQYAVAVADGIDWDGILDSESDQDSGFEQDD